MGQKPSTPLVGTSHFAPYSQEQPYAPSSSHSSPSPWTSLPSNPNQKTMSSKTPEKDPGKPPFPPFTKETATIKVKAAQNMWNTKDPHKVKLAYTNDCIWRNRDVFIKGQEQIVEFLTNKWGRENGYRLRKELFAFSDDRIAVQFWYEYYDTEGQWWRCYGLEDWTFAEDGRMKKRQMSGNDVRIADHERWFLEGVDVNTVEISDAHW